MSHPSQVCMSELQPFMTPAFIVNAFQKLGHHPVKATLTKKRKGDDKEICIVQFANDDAAKLAVFKLNGKPIPSSGFHSTKFKLSQCIGNRTTEYNVWVGDLTLDVDDYHFFKFFCERYKTLCNAKVILDARGVSKGYGFLRFSSEEEQQHCLKNMGGSLGLGCRPIRVGPVTKAHTNSNAGSAVDSADGEENTLAETLSPEDEYWRRYTQWNQFKEPKEYSFIAVKLKIQALRDENNPNNDLRLVDYNVPVNVDDLNKEIIERECNLWDAIECTKWLPETALSTATNTKS